MRLRGAIGGGASLEKKSKNQGIEAITRGLRLIQKPLWIPFSRGSISLNKEEPLPKALRDHQTPGGGGGGRGGCCLELVGQGAAPTHTRLAGQELRSSAPNPSCNYPSVFVPLPYFVGPETKAVIKLHNSSRR
jgi:hypothetical protein